MVAGLTTRDVRVSAAQAESLYERALIANNLLAQWGASGARVVTCVLGEDPDTGVGGADRLLAAHLRLGGGGAGVFLEALGNFAALTKSVNTHTRRPQPADPSMKPIPAVLVDNQCQGAECIYVRGTAFSTSRVGIPRVHGTSMPGTYTQQRSRLRAASGLTALGRGCSHPHLSPI